MLGAIYIYNGFNDCSWFYHGYGILACCHTHWNKQNLSHDYKHTSCTKTVSAHCILLLKEHHKKKLGITYRIYYVYIVHSLMIHYVNIQTMFNIQIQSDTNTLMMKALT